jgi:hypothetical protein
MGEIYDTNMQFEFDKITLTTPSTISGGVHFSKILINRNQLYIQTPKCKTKLGIVKSGKKFHADLVFTNEDEEFIQWVESLEQTVRKHIFTNRERWFDMDLDEDDIESYFTPTIKLFKSGKQYIMRVNISQRIGSTPLKIYDENELDVEMDTINENTSLISILEVQGVRCSTKSFQIDIELKQIMVIKPVNLFEKCIIKKHKPIAKAPVPTATPVEKDLAKTGVTQPENVATPVVNLEEPNEDDIIDDSSVSSSSDDDEAEEEEGGDFEKNEAMAKQEEIQDSESEMDPEEPKDDDILEINLDVEEIKDQDTVHLKEKTEVYYQMYREARQKAKLAKSLALSSYLEARRIKNLYMLDDIDDSDESDLEEK